MFYSEIFKEIKNAKLWSIQKVQFWDSEWHRRNALRYDRSTEFCQINHSSVQIAAEECFITLT